MIGRFINADTTDVLTFSSTALTDKNLYAYCDNDPVNRSDDGGDIWYHALRLSGGSAFLAACVATLKTVGTAVATAVGTITPAGWVAIGVVVVVTTAAYVVPKAVKKIKDTIYSSKRAVSVSKGGRQRIRDTGLVNLSDEEVTSRAKDKSLPASERKRYTKEQKARRKRNQQKRNS